MTIERAAATANFTLNATTYALVTGLTLTPAAGDYFMFCTVEMDTPNPAGSDENMFAVFLGGSIISHTVRRYGEDTSVDDTTYAYMLSCAVTMSGSNAVEIRHEASSSGSPQVAQRREMNLFPVTGTVQVTGVGNTTIATSTWTTLLAATTPASGTYLVCFSSSYEGPSTNELGLRVVFGGTPTIIAASPRFIEQESSGASDHVPVNTIAVVTVDGTEDIEVQFQRTSGSGDCNVDSRTMNLIPTAIGDIKEATGTADDADSTTTNKLVDNMTITDPGVDDWLCLFSTSEFIGSVADNAGEITYSIRNAGSEVTDSPRINEHEGSLDLVNMISCCGGRVTVAGATDDLEIFWQGSTTTERIAHERTFIALREPVAATTSLPPVQSWSNRSPHLRM